MVVSCSDGTVYIWQMETGHLDRVVHGVTAEEILNNCDENAMPMEQLSNPNLTLSQAIKRHNLATFKNLAQQKLHAQGQHQQMAGTKLDLLQPQDYPMYIQGIRTNKTNPESHVVFFDTEALIVQLLTNEYALMSPGELEAKGLVDHLSDKRTSSVVEKEAAPMISGLLTKVKDTADSVSQKIQASVDAAGFSPIPTQGSPVVTRKRSQSDSPQKPEKLMIRTNNLVMDIAQLFVSVLHAWGLDADLDMLCINKLGLLKPKFPICFGLISRDGHMSLMMPGWHRSVCMQDVSSVIVNEDSNANLMQQVKANVDENMRTHLDIIGVGKKVDTVMRNPADCLSEMSLKQAIDNETHIFLKKARWQVSAAVSTQHLLSAISVANTLMSMNHATFKTSKPAIRNKSGQKLAIPEISAPDSEDAGLDEALADTTIIQAQYKQGWSLLAAHHCLFLPELVDSKHYFSPQLEMLAQRWQDRCLEIREAAQALLLAELHRIGPDGRNALVGDWAPYLPTSVNPQLSILSTESYPAQSDEKEDEGETEQLFEGDSPLHKPSKSFEIQRKQATAIVMLAVLGAEFGNEILPYKKVPEDPTNSRQGLEGFTCTSYLLAQHTSQALKFLLQQPPSKKLPANTPIRRAAIDLIGRGFPVWESHLDVSVVLLSLLELCVGVDKVVPNITLGLPLSPAADACRSARHALSLIALARPAVFIITIAKEVTKYLALAQTAPQSHSNIHNSVLVRAKSEILRVIELLVEKMPSDVADHIVEAMEIIIHCLDANQLKVKGLQELFPAICRFSMVTCCSLTHRIWVGAKTGNLVFYELKQNSKCQIIPAHAGQIIAVSVSPDGKFLATYSHIDQKLKFWQTSSSSLFGIGSQHMKFSRQIVMQPIQVNQNTNLLKLVRFSWTDGKVINLLTQDGTERTFNV